MTKTMGVLNNFVETNINPELTRTGFVNKFE